MERIAARLTVLIFTCNHAKYIRQAIESVFLQRISEPFKVIIADDQSTDSTRQIIEKFVADRSNGQSVSFLNNPTESGMTSIYRRAFRACQTEFVAILEGKDYWINPDKLTAQMAFLDEHIECSAVSANYFVYDADTSRLTARAPASAGFTYLDSRSLIRDNLIGNLSTCMYRLTALRSIPDTLYDAVASDWGINICVARYGFIGFMHKPFSVYRIQHHETQDKLSCQGRDATQLRCIEHFDIVTERVFAKEFQALKDRVEQPAVSDDQNRLWLCRISAILKACLPPFVLFSLNWAGRTGIRILLPPIVPIAIKKLRRIIP